MRCLDIVVYIFIALLRQFKKYGNAMYKHRLSSLFKLNNFDFSSLLFSFSSMDSNELRKTAMTEK